MLEIKSSKQKKSAAGAYESPELNLVMGEVLHPGGLKLTARLAEAAQIQTDSRVLDIASGRGTGACYLASKYGCRVTGIDLSPAFAKIRDPIKTRVFFAMADAEHLPFPDATFDVVISECAFSLLPDKITGAAEIARVLKPKGRAAITDIYLKNELPAYLKQQMNFHCCFTGAETRDEYINIFARAGLVNICLEDYSRELIKLAWKLQSGYGSLADFWARFGNPSARVCTSGITDKNSSWKDLFKATKPGYALFSFSKPDQEADNEKNNRRNQKSLSDLFQGDSRDQGCG